MNKIAKYAARAFDSCELWTHDENIVVTFIMIAENSPPNSEAFCLAFFLFLPLFEIPTTADRLLIHFYFAHRFFLFAHIDLYHYLATKINIILSLEWICQSTHYWSHSIAWSRRLSMELEKNTLSHTCLKRLTYMRVRIPYKCIKIRTTVSVVVYFIFWVQFYSFCLSLAFTSLVMSHHRRFSLCFNRCKMCE